MLYPLKFFPIFKYKLWGGEKIKSILKKNFSPLTKCGESWELSGVRDNISVVSNGNLQGKNLVELIEKYKGKLLGERVYAKYNTEFPLLIKFIDANDDLSIQVHPDDTLAKERHNSYGKTEMWYIVQADEDARLISGFSRDLDRDTYLNYFNSGNLMKILNEVRVSSDEVYFIPAGRVHSIGKGLLLAEIQQTSDITYRIWDFDRVDSDGKKRKLHLDESLDAMDFKIPGNFKFEYVDRTDHPVRLVECSYFTTNKLLLNNSIERNYKTLGSFVILICLEGTGTVEYNQRYTVIDPGDVVLIPALLDEIVIYPVKKMKVLETYITR